MEWWSGGVVEWWSGGVVECGRAYRDRSNDYLKGTTSHASATREAPAQAELRPTSAASSGYRGPTGRRRR
jgi:hypothetical protein